MRLDQAFPEAMFAFAANHELSRLSPWWATHIPIIPTLRRERRGGYDVRFDLPGTVLLVQYKLSKRRRQLQLTEAQKADSEIVRYIRALAQSGIDQFWTTDHQHRLIARIATRFPFCYYVAPRFTSRADLDFLFAEKRILASSMIVKLSQFPPVRRGHDGRHRIVAPIGFSRNFIFSEPSTHASVDIRKELRSIWQSWEPTEPLAATLEKVWRWAPRGNKRRAIAHARHEVAMLKQVPLEPEYPVALPELTHALPPPSVSVGTSVDVPTRRRRPPWPEKAFGPLQLRAELGNHLDQTQRLSAISYLFNLIGIQMSVVQPSEKALD